jgi:hypothetical protein
MTKLTDFVNLDAPIVGIPDRVIPLATTVDRGRGCWNCIHWDVDKGKKHWENRRQGLLATALQHEQLAGAARVEHKKLLADAHEKRAKGLGMMVDSVDQAVIAGKFGLCAKGWAPPDCKDPVPLIEHSNLCPNWSGRDGASLATAGKPLDLLPDELRELHHPKPDPALIAKAKAEAEEAKRLEAQRIHLPVLGNEVK